MISVHSGHGTVKDLGAMLKVVQINFMEHCPTIWQLIYGKSITLAAIAKVVRMLGLLPLRNIGYSI